MDRHSIGRRARPHAVFVFALVAALALPIAADGVALTSQRPSLDGAPSAVRASNPVAVPPDPRAAAALDFADVATLNRRAAATAAHQQAVAAAKAHAAKARAAALARARAAALARARAAAQAKARAARQRTIASAPAQTHGTGGTFRGRNRMWYPALGMSYSVSWFPCSRSRPPDNYVYRWGCAGWNNAYLMAHAWGKFAPLNRAYYSGRLARGQLLVYADNSGRIHRYRLSWWRTYPPLASASWAWASQSRSSATLQTCVGSNSQLRLFVRFVEA